MSAMCGVLAGACGVAVIVGDWIERPLWAIAGAIFVLASTQVDPS